MEDAFRFTGFGFSPHQPVQRFVRESNGAVIDLGVITSDNLGHINWEFPLNSAAQPASNRVWAVDLATGRPSNVVYELIELAPPCRVVR